LPALLAIALVAGALVMGWRKHNQRLAEAVAPAPQPLTVAVRPAAPAPRPVVTAVPVAPPPQAGPASSEAAPRRPLPSLQTFPWSEGASGYRSAADEQRSSGCPMLLYFRTDWCPYCKQFDSGVLTDSAVSAAIAPAVKVRINPEKGEEENALAKKFGVNGYPHVVLVAKDGSAPVDLSTGVSRERSPEPARFAESVRGYLTYAWDSEASADVNAGKLDDAIRYADMLLAFDPKYSNGRGYFLRALAFHKKGEHAEALRDIRAGCAEGCAECCNIAR
jgi:thiol-disulfide isomerase/thioredoxin